MLLTAVGMVVFMPFAVLLMVKGLTVSAWAIGKPLLIVALLPPLWFGVPAPQRGDGTAPGNRILVVDFLSSVVSIPTATR